jgi:hypothetical protein
VAIAMAATTGTQIEMLSSKGEEKMPAPGTVGTGVGVAAKMESEIT